jgi:hypothetical protein
MIEIPYKNKVVFLRKSKKGEHLYAFDNDGAFAAARDGSILMNISDVHALIHDEYKSIKVSIMEKEDATESG